MFKIEENKIKFNPDNFASESDAIQEARDYGNQVFYNEIFKGSILYFDDWNFKNGVINFRLSNKS